VFTRTPLIIGAVAAVALWIAAAATGFDNILALLWIIAAAYVVLGLVVVFVQRRRGTAV
jgi:hypothetical protein